MDVRIPSRGGPKPLTKADAAESLQAKRLCLLTAMQRLGEDCGKDAVTPSCSNRLVGRGADVVLSSPRWTLHDLK